MAFSSELVHHLRALTRAIYVVTDEEDTFIQDFRKQMPKYTERTFVFNRAFGMMKIDDLVNDWQNRTHTREGSDIPAALKRIYTDDPREFEHFYILTDPDVILDDEFSVRQVMNIIHQLHNDPQIVKCLIFVGSSRFIPAKLSRYIEVVELHGLDQEELLKTVTDSCSNFKMDPPADYVSLFRGFTSYEIDQVITQAMVSVMVDPRASKRIDPHFVSEYRRKQIRKTDLVQIIDTQKFTFKSVGGVERFKEWASATKSCWTPEGRKFGLRVPRGVLLMGVYGCGKSLSAKALATEWELPLVQLELGQLRNPAVGRSENNLIQALRIIETVAPCVTGETEITLADGSIRTIQDLWQDTPDDLQVKCWNEKMFRVASTKVMAITRRISEAFRVEAANGYYLNPTANHEHYVLRGGMPEWVRTDELNVGDMLAVPTTTWGCENGSKKLSERHLVDYISVLGSSASQLKQLYEAECRWVEVTEIAPIGEQEVFDLVCEGDDTHSFFANGLITHNCAVWIDEAEKSLAGGASSAQSDAGTTSRMLGILSTWAQELESPVSLILTANSLRNLPPEMVNRLPDRFFFDVPDESSVIDILKIHTGEFNQDVSGFQLGELAKAAASLVGREIEQCVESAMTASFNAKKPALDEEILHHELKTKSRIITTMKDEIAELTEWVGYDPDTDDGVKAKLAAPKRRGKSFKIVGSASRV